jgi:uncharacterized membrane protein YjgN (DUF898 family)
MVIGGAPVGGHRLSYHGSSFAFFALVFRNLLLTLVTLGVYLP